MATTADQESSEHSAWATRNTPNLDADKHHGYERKTKPDLEPRIENPKDADHEEARGVVHEKSLPSAAALDSTLINPLGEKSSGAAPVSKEAGDTSGVAEGDGAVEEEEEAEDESKYPSGLPIIFLTFGLCLTTFVIALDNTIIATAIPTITHVFNSLGDVGWYGSSYLLTQTALQPTFGKIFTFFSVKWTYLTALLIFELGSVLCAAAQSSQMLIVGRALAGAGAAGLFSGSLTIVGYSVPLRKRAIYIGAVSSMFGIASVVGPILGGAFTDRVSWRWCFWINLPFGGAAFAVVLFFFKNPPRKHTDMTFKQKIQEMDLLGALFLMCAIVCLLLALQWGGTTYAWRDSRVWGNLLGFGLIISVFIGIQFWRVEQATIPPRIISNRSMAATSVFMALLLLALYDHIFYLPFYFQAVLGTTAEGSGIRTIPLLVSMTFGSIFTGGMVTLVGWYTPFLWIGSAIYVVGAGLLYTLKTDTSAARWIGYQILTGAGAGICIQVPFIIPQVVLSPKDMPTGNALVIFFNSLGGALSVSIAQNIFSNELQKQLEMVPNITQGLLEAIIGAGATGVRLATPDQFLGPVLVAYDFAITHAFILPIAAGGLAFFSSFFVEWKSVKGKKIAMGGA